MTITGGYAFVETSKINGRNPNSAFESAMLISSRKESTGPKGKCLRFW